MGLEYFSNSGLWPSNYSDSIRVFLEDLGVRKGKAPGISECHPAPAIVEQPVEDLLSTGRPLVDVVHRLEYFLFRRWGDLMDQVGLGSSFALIGTMDRRRGGDGRDQQRSSSPIPKRG